MDQVEQLIDIVLGYVYEDWLDRKAAAKSLGQIGDARAVEPLIKTLGDKDWKVRVVAAKSLSEIGDVRAVEPLIKVLGNKDDEDWGWYVRKVAAEALGKIEIGYARAVEPLIKTLGDRDKDVREAAAEALEKIGWKPSDEKEQAAYLIAKRDWVELARIGKPSVELITKVLNDDSLWVRKAAAATLKKIPYFNSIEKKIPFILCSKCLCRFDEYKARILLLTLITYHVCRKCHSNVHLIENAEKVVAFLDRAFEKPYTYNGTTLFVNWFQHKEPFDFDEIHIKDADDFDVEEMVVKLRNDTDADRRKRYRSMPVYIASNLKLSKAKRNMLKDTFGKIIENIDGEVFIL